MNRQFEYADVTDIGSREENQDFHDHVFTADGALLVLADGMGVTTGVRSLRDPLCSQF
ncbi:MAG: hypothetical protein IH808_06045 [Proteobacteria bacterium]|nr:hypothetical protein [Pseudomonadota bacterium]